MISNFFSIYIYYLKFFRYSNNKNKLYACLVQDKLNILFNDNEIKLIFKFTWYIANIRTIMKHKIMFN